MSANLEKRLAEAFMEITDSRSYWAPERRRIIGLCAHIAAEEIEKAARRAFAEAVHLSAVQMPNMTIRDQDAVFAQMPAALARIIGADGHEGGEEVKATETVRTETHIAEPPRPQELP